MTALTVLQARDLGLLQEINRRLLHPLGFQLESDGLNRFLLTDRRAQPEGVKFSFALSAEKASRIAILAHRRAEARLSTYGWLVQPVEGYDDHGPAALSLDDETVEFCIDLAQRYVEESDGEVADQVGAIEHFLVNAIGALFQRLATTSGGLLKVLSEDQLPAQAQGKLTLQQLARARWLAREILPFAHRRYIGDNLKGDPQYEEREPELRFAECEEAKVLSAEVASWPYDEAPDSGVRVYNRLEELWHLAQPGMRYWRGGPEHKARWADLRAKVKDQLERYKGSRQEIDAFLAGDLAVTKVRDPKALKAALLERLEPLQGALNEIDEQRARVVTEMGPLQHALARLG